jgi:hypothetical protein
MKKISIVLILALITGFSVQLRADEGMWLPLMIKRLNHQDMQKMGLQLTAEEIYSVNNSSLKDAIVSLGGFCTGEIISADGLMLTNHHCGFDAIRTHSKVGQDYLTDGFWAMSREQELPNEGLTASFVVRMEDVTERVLADVTADMNEETRGAKVAEVSKAIEAEAKEGNHYRCQVRSFFEGNEYYLFVYEVFTDVRLVGAPPSSIGKFGGDTDNWMWPRHTGDFTLFRVYSGPDGKPAPYSADNIPMKAKHHLPISIQGVKQDDFAMIFGFPGSTERYMTSYGIQQALDLKNPTVVDIRDLKLKLLKEDMDASDAIRIKYASKYAQTANYWKYFIGQSRGLKRLKVYDKKKALENEFEKWVAADASRKAKYGEALNMIKAGYAAEEATAVGNTYLMEAGIQSADVILFAFRFDRLYQAYSNAPDENAKAALRSRLDNLANTHFEEYSESTDKKLFSQMLAKYYNDVDATQHPAFFNTVRSKFKGDWNKFTEKAYSTSIFTDRARYDAFLNKPNQKKLESDLLAIASGDIMGMYFGAGAANAEADEKKTKGYRLFIAGLREMQPDKSFAPDANSTLRFTYGTVGAYKPGDAMHYNYYTTAEGILEKEDPSNDEFIVPDKLAELIRNKDFGQYADANGELPVCFISNNDITGGNSGSPVINGKGHLIGCAFDGNWEAMSGDIAFETELQRTISVDARYILFIIDKYAGAKHLIDEMTIVRN